MLEPHESGYSRFKQGVMKRDALIFLLMVVPWICAFPASWELPTQRHTWRSPGGDVTSKLISQKGGEGPRYRLQLRRNGEKPLWIGEPKPGQWIDPSWAGLAWLESAPHAWSDGRLFFQEGLFIAILDLREGTFLVNHQTEFCLKIGDLRWLYVASRGKNSFARADILGIVGEGALAKKAFNSPATRKTGSSSTGWGNLSTCKDSSSLRPWLTRKPSPSW